MVNDNRVKVDLAVVVSGAAGKGRVERELETAFFLLLSYR